MGEHADKSAQELAIGPMQHADSPASKGKAPRTARGEKTLRKILDAALAEFGETRFSRQLDRRDHQPRQGRAGHLLHLFRQQGGGVRGAGPRHVGAGARPCRAGTVEGAPTRSMREAPRAGRLSASSSLDHKEVYRIIDEAEFVDPDGLPHAIMKPPPRASPRGSRPARKGEMRDGGRARHRGPRLGDHGDERLPRPALRGVGRARTPDVVAAHRQRDCCATGLKP